jgi:hypothetical protein
MEVICKLNLSENIIFTDEYVALFVDKPSVLDDLPTIDSLSINSKYLHMETPETMLDYFEHLKDLRIYVLNGLNLICEADSYYCDYCNRSIEDNWFYCYHCYKDMCKLCLKSCLISDSNNELNECRQCNQIEPRNIYNLSPMSDMQTCDICDNRICLSDSFYSLKYNLNNVCTSCYDTRDDARNMVETKAMHFIDLNNRNNYYFNYTGIGSMLFWFPIVSDDKECRVLLNLNPNDINYGKICLQSCDNHGRYGYFIMQDKQWNLSHILQRLNEICDKGTFEYECLEKVEDAVYGDDIVTKNGEMTLFKKNILKEAKYEYIMKTAPIGETYHSSPIQLLMIELKMPVYYG